MKTMEGFETSSTATVRRRRCSTDNPLKPGRPTRALRKPCMSTKSNTCSSHPSVNMHALTLACRPAVTPPPCCYLSALLLPQGPAATPARPAATPRPSLSLVHTHPQLGDYRCCVDSAHNCAAAGQWHDATAPYKTSVQTGRNPTIT